MAAADTVAVHLKPGKEKALRDGHPWVFSGAIARIQGSSRAPLAEVFDARGQSLGLGFFSSQSQIRVRMLGPDAAAADPGFFARRLASARLLRQAILPPDTTGYRLLNAEGDGVPGWTVDLFGGALVSQITVAGLEALKSEAYAALREDFPGLPILQVNDLPSRRAEGLSLEDEVIEGEPPAESAFREAGLAFTADLAGGQKTGFYCDQRENRRLAGTLAGSLPGDRTVLDLFAHSGAFGLHALRGGASRVVFVESSAKLLDRGRRHCADNGVDPDGASVEWVKANVFEDLREREERYGLVVCDPPPLVRKRPDVDAAARAYKDLNRLSFQRVAPGGFLLTFTCSGAVDAKLFRQILFAAAVEAGVDAALLAPLGAAPDHPVAITHPQGEYLKGWLIAVR